jgi:hypothetical protein
MLCTVSVIVVLKKRVVTRAWQREREREREMNTTKQIISVWWDQCPHHVIKFLVLELLIHCDPAMGFKRG